MPVNYREWSLGSLIAHCPTRNVSSLSPLPLGQKMCQISTQSFPKELWCWAGKKCALSRLVFIQEVMYRVSESKFQFMGFLFDQQDEEAEVTLV